MHLRRVRVEGFGCLRDLEWQFPAGGLLVLGPNESGKSTLLTCIETILFGLKPAAARAWHPWAGGEFAGELELAGEEGSLLVRRSFADNHVTAARRDAAGSLVEELGPVKLAPGGRIRERELFGNWLSAAIGVGDGDLFRRSLYIPQGRLQVELDRLDNILRSYLTGGGLDVAAVTRGLTERRRGVSRHASEGRANLGVLELLRDRLGQLRDQLQRAEAHERRLAELRQELNALRDELTEQTRERQRLRALLQAADRARQLEQTGSHLKDLMAAGRRDLKADGERRAQVAELARRLEPDRKLLQRAEEVSGALADWKRAGDGASAARQRLETAEQGAAERGVGWPLKVGVPGGLALAGVVIGALLGGGWAVGVGLAAGVVLGLVALRLLARWSSGRAQVELRRRDLEEARADLAAAARRPGELVPEVEGEELGDLGGRLQEAEELQRRMGELEAGLLVEDAVQELQENTERRAAELEGVTDELTGAQRELDEAGLVDPAAVEDAQKRWSGLDEQVRAGEARWRTLREQAAELRGALSRPAGVLAEEVEELEEREQGLAGRFSGLVLAEELWAEAVECFQSTYLELYGERVGAWLSELSGGLYRSVELQGEGEEFQAERAWDGRRVPVSRLSQGAQDRLYLALRLALAEVMGEQGVRGPLLLDDPFVTFDAERLADAFRNLQRVAEHHQVILLAHDEGYRALGWPVRELPVEVEEGTSPEEETEAGGG